ncbi:hypothetical protein BEL04_07325 [Mucilaginibacter sp. PPCGB 2223]|nr:hypothetical protein BEL04_07325 [Mucilaginibacter sp. PPCGB 2223]
MKRLVYILILLLFTARLLAASPGHIPANGVISYPPAAKPELAVPAAALPVDTLRIKTVPQSHMDVLGAKKIKEIAKPKHQSKPEKVVAPVDTATVNKKAKRQRRPEGLERPPEIPRRNND